MSRIYQDKDAAQNAKPFVASALGCSPRDLVVVRSGTGYRIRTRQGLERWLATKANGYVDYGHTKAKA